MSKFKGRERLQRKLGAFPKAVRNEVRRELLRGALLIENDAVASIQEQTPSGKFVRSRGDPTKLHEVSPPGSAPNADTGELHTSITTTRKENSTGIVVETGANTPYATPLELGTAKIAPRPYMGPAFRGNVQRIEDRVRAAVRRGNRRGGL